MTSDVGMGCAYAVAIIFTLAAGEKVAVLRARSAAWHPVLLHRRGLRIHAARVVAISIVLDLVCIILMVVRPQMGAALAAGLLIVYSVAARPAMSESASPCNCLPGLLDAKTAVGLYSRNIAVAVVALVAARTASGPEWPTLTAFLVASLSGCLVVLITRLGDGGGGRRRSLASPVSL